MQQRYMNYYTPKNAYDDAKFNTFVPTFPTVIIFRDGSEKVEDIFKPCYEKLAIAKWLYRDAKVGTIILYDHITHLDYHGHCLDFMIKRTEKGWQPYVSSFDVDDERPLQYHVKPEYFTKFTEELFKSIKEQLENLEL